MFVFRSMNWIIRPVLSNIAQQKSFLDIYNKLIYNKSFKFNREISSLNIFFGEHDLIRVGADQFSRRAKISDTLIPTYISIYRG